MKYFITSLTLFIAFMANAQTKEDINKVIKKAYAYKAQYDEPNTFKTFDIAYGMDSNNLDACWNLAYYYALMGRREKDGSDTQNKYFDLSLQMAKKSFSLDSLHSKSNYAMALAMGIVALRAGPTEKIAASKAIKRYAEKSVEQEPKWAKSWYILGRWHHAVENLNFLEVLAADLLFGGAPEGSSMEESIRCLKFAVENEPTSILYHYSLAAAYADIDQEEEALKVLEIALKLPILETDSEFNRNLCIKLKEDIN